MCQIVIYIFTTCMKGIGNKLQWNWRYPSTVIYPLIYISIKYVPPFHFHMPPPIIVKIYLQQEATERALNYHTMLAIEGQDLIPNTDEFDCPVCFTRVDQGEGVVLRECLHVCCR